MPVFLKKRNAGIFSYMTIYLHAGICERLHIRCLITYRSIKRFCRYSSQCFIFFSDLSIRNTISHCICFIAKQKCFSFSEKHFFNIMRLFCILHSRLRNWIFQEQVLYRAFQILRSVPLFHTLHLQRHRLHTHRLFFSHRHGLYHRRP